MRPERKPPNLLGGGCHSQHALPRKVLRGISRREVEQALRSGSKSRHDGRVVASFRYFDVVCRRRIFVITVKPRW